MTAAGIKTIAVLAHTESPHLHDYLRGVRDFASESADWSLHGIGLPCYHEIPNPNTWQGDACLVFNKPQSKLARMILDKSETVVSIGKISEETSSISYDIRSGILKALRHLAGQGCRKILLHQITSPGLVRLLENYADNLKLQIEAPGSDDISSVIANSNPPLGVLVPDCKHALEIQRIAQTEGLPMPVLVALGDDKNCRLSDSGISSLAYPARELGYRAAQLLHHQINHPARSRHLIFGETELNLRRSSQHQKIDDSIVQEALNQIRLKVAHSPILVSDLAKLVGVSRTNLTERFQSNLGLPPADVIRRERLEIAKRRLKRPDEMVKSVALSLGFSSSQEFARFFKNATGQTPTEFVNPPQAKRIEPNFVKKHQRKPVIS